MCRLDYSAAVVYTQCLHSEQGVITFLSNFLDGPASRVVELLAQTIYLFENIVYYMNVKVIWQRYFIVGRLVDLSQFVSDAITCYLFLLIWQYFGNPYLLLGFHLPI
jgi:hypothetical protein